MVVERLQILGVQLKPSPAGAASDGLVDETPSDGMNAIRSANAADLETPIVDNPHGWRYPSGPRRQMFATSAAASST
jgi:hypothetical protein